jgi:hypothetical protein
MPCSPALQQVRQRGSTEGGAPPGSSGRVFKPDVVLVSYEAAASEMATLRAVRWEAVVLDLRQK